MVLHAISLCEFSDSLFFQQRTVFWLLLLFILSALIDSKTFSAINQSWLLILAYFSYVFSSTMIEMVSKYPSAVQHSILKYVSHWSSLILLFVKGFPTFCTSITHNRIHYSEINYRCSWKFVFISLLTNLKDSYILISLDNFVI
jgi:hypothetical protein